VLDIVEEAYASAWLAKPTTLDISEYAIRKKPLSPHPVPQLFFTIKHWFISSHPMSSSAWPPATDPETYL
jgi:hypothetical protein